MCADKSILAFVILLFFFTPLAWAQKTKGQLQKEKQQNLTKIKEVEKILSETSSRKKNTLGELSALNQRIKEQVNLVNSIKGEIGLLDSEISENNDIIRALEDDLKKLRKEYASMLYAAQKANSSTSRLTFLFSSKSFDQMIMRLRYMEQYAETRKLQAEQIIQVQNALAGEVTEIQNKRTEKNKLLEEQLTQGNHLTGLKKKQSSLVRSLEKEERQLRRDLEDTRKAIALLDKKINAIIKEELEREARALKSNRSVALSNSFEENKAKFPWPVSGFISMKFGKQNHPVLKGIVIQNDGINIQTQQGEKVKAIFDGEVARVAFTPGIGSTILIKHGTYFTLYTGLKDISVKEGQHVGTNQELGNVLTNSDGISELRFRIYKNITPLDPQVWLQNM
jgi:septal ring factor EnvC (AmiA/AmiB activator)